MSEADSGNQREPIEDGAMYDEERPYTVVPQAYSREYRQGAWGAAAGLQAVDGLEVSEFSHGLAVRYIEGEYDSLELRERIESHYAEEHTRQAEADVVASRIVGLLEAAPSLPAKIEPCVLRRIHKALFEGQLPDERWVGQWRTENIAKEEPVLGGRSVEYADYRLIRDNLEYDFNEERAYAYEDMRTKEDIHHFADFIVRVWETHPFREGNTRTVATYAQIRLAQHGIRPGNEVFRTKSVWFRDALVRASYAKIREGIEAEPAFIRAFFENLVGYDNALEEMDLNVHGIRTTEVPYRQQGTPRGVGDEAARLRKREEATTPPSKARGQKRPRGGQNR